MCAPVNRAKGSWRSTRRNFFSNSFEYILCGVLKSLLLTDWILNGFLTHKPPTFTITLSITIFIHTTLLPRKVPIYTAVSIMIASLEQTILFSCLLSFGLEGGDESNASCEIAHSVVKSFSASQTQKNTLFFPEFSGRDVGGAERRNSHMGTHHLGFILSL